MWLEENFTDNDNDNETTEKHTQQEKKKAGN